MPRSKRGTKESVGAAPRAAILARVSTGKQHLDAQTAALVQEAERRGFQVVATIEDVGSGRKMQEREGLRRVMELADAGAIDVLLVAELSRIGRSLSGLSAVVERLASRGVGLVSLRESFDLSSPMGRMVCGILSVLAVWEADVLRERTREGLRAAKRRRSRVGGAPYGTRWVEETSDDPERDAPPAHLEAVPEEIAVLRRAIDLRASLGRWDVAADALNAEGHRTRSGTPWLRNKLAKASRNPRVQPFLAGPSTGAVAAA